MLKMRRARKVREGFIRHHRIESAMCSVNRESSGAAGSETLANRGYRQSVMDLLRPVSFSKGARGRRDWRDEIRDSRGEKRDVCSEACCLISSLVSRLSNLVSRLSSLESRLSNLVSRISSLELAVCSVNREPGSGGVWRPLPIGGFGARVQVRTRGTHPPTSIKKAIGLAVPAGLKRKLGRNSRPYLLRQRLQRDSSSARPKR